MCNLNQRHQLLETTKSLLLGFFFTPPSYFETGVHVAHAPLIVKYSSLRLCFSGSIGRGRGGRGPD